MKQPLVEDKKSRPFSFCSQSCGRVCSVYREACSVCHEIEVTESMYHPSTFLCCLLESSLLKVFLFRDILTLLMEKANARCDREPGHSKFLDYVRMQKINFNY